MQANTEQQPAVPGPGIIVNGERHELDPEAPGTLRVWPCAPGLGRA